MRLDTHQHFWTLAQPFTSWPTPAEAAIHRDFGPADLRPHLEAGDIAGTILIQAAPSLAETRFLLDIARGCTFVRGVVGWIDFDAPQALQQLAELAADPLFKGVRPMVQDIAEPGWILRPKLAPVFEAMIAHELRLDALVRHWQIDEIAELARRHLELPIVLDHGGKPAIDQGELDLWAERIARLAMHRSVYCKLSGLWTEAGGEHSAARMRRYVEHLLSCFGPDRLMWASDWPVLELAGRYDDWLAQCEQLLAGLSVGARSAIFGANGMRFYGIDPI